MRNLSKIILLILTLAGCKTSRDLQGNNYLDDNAPANRGLALVTKADIPLRAPVSSIAIDSSSMLINELRVGKQTYLSYETPVLIYQLPKISDYVEIIRCKQEVIIFGGQTTIDNVDINSPNLESQIQTMRRNDFWKSASSQNGCELITTSYTDLVYEDANCPSGDYFYLLRACVDPNRLDSLGYSTANCSRQIAISSRISHIDQRGEAQFKALAKANDLRQRIDTVGRQISQNIIDLQDHLYECQTKNKKRVASAQQEEAISRILSLAPTLGVPALGALAMGTRYRSPAMAAAFGAAALATPIIALAYQATTNPQSNYPQEASSCYTDGASTQKLIKSGGNQNGDSGSTVSDSANTSAFCACAKAQGTQAKIKILTDELSSLVKQTNQVLDQASQTSTTGAKDGT